MYLSASLALCFVSLSPSQLPEPQVTCALHAVWTPDLTVNQPQSQCATSGTVAAPHFHFYVGWKGPLAFLVVDWILVEELTNEHTPQIWYFANPQGSNGFPQGCSMLPVSDPQNWRWMTWNFPMTAGFWMHNSPYRVTVQWRYWVQMKGQRGPFQTSIEVNVQNLVVTSSDETKVLKWDPVRGIAETSFSYSLECAQRKVCDVCISIYSTDGTKVYEIWLEKIAPGSYSFTWDGSVNVMPPPFLPDGLAPAGLYVFDIEVIGIAPGYDEDTLRSRTLRIGEHEVVPLAPRLYDAQYILRSNRNASQAWVEVYDPLLHRIAGPINGPTNAIPEESIPTDADWNHIHISVDLQYASDQPYRFVFGARDNFPDYDKAHRKKVCLLNQGVRLMGWCLSSGFFYPNFPNTPWGWWGFYSLDTREAAQYVSQVVQRVVIPTPSSGRTLVGLYRRHIHGSFFGQEDLLYTYAGGADDFGKGNGFVRVREPSEWGKLDKAIQTYGWGLIHWAGHSDGGRIIAFPDDDPEPIYLFGIGGWGSWKHIDITTFPQGYLSNVKVVYLGGCHSCTNENGGGLPQAFVNKGARAAVGWHVYRKSLVKGNTEPDKIFWASLTGHCTWYKVGSTVEEAAWAAARSYIYWWSVLNGYHWRQYLGIAGNPSERLY